MPLTLGAIIVWYAGWVSRHNLLLCMYKETSCLGYLLVHAMRTLFTGVKP